MDQSNRYADLSLREEDLISGGKHILVAYKMKPKAGTGYLEAAAHFAAESSTGTNVEVSTTDDFTKGVDALALKIREVAGEYSIPVVENPPLAQSLYRTVEVGQAIPEKLYAAVAEILASRQPQQPHRH